MSVHVFGIRHHGPGSARSLRAALDALGPDVVLVEGPPDADELLALAGREEMRPPVALLLYDAESLFRAERGTTARAAYYPFAEFSPEWVAVRHALARGVPVRFMDLPVTHWMAIEAEEEAAHANAEREAEGETAAEETGAEAPSSEQRVPSAESLVRRDPLQRIAEAAGYEDGERFWEQLVEERRDHGGVFEAVLEVMTALREAPDEAAPVPDEGAPEPSDQRVERLREAWMRQTIRRAIRDGHERIAVVCGAWHAPALAAAELATPARADAALLKGLPKLKVQATWIPWTSARLARASGYGAGITSPGWYQHVWTHGAGDASAIAWMTLASRLLRDEGIDASPAQAIDAVRLASTLAALRGRSVPGLPELDEGILAALLAGDPTPLELVRRRLVIGDLLGAVPDDAPAVPLQASIAREQTRLRLKPEAAARALELDLRKPLDLERSVFLHRLRLLGVEWGAAERASGKGTFKELWRLEWRPELALAVIEAAVWGTTVADAAAARAADLASRAPSLPALADLLGRLLLADVPSATRTAIARLDALAAASGDVAELADALPPLAGTLRYGDVRGTDREMLGHVVSGLVARITAGLPAACGSLDDDAAAAMYARVVACHDAVTRLQDADLTGLWQEALRRVLGLPAAHGVVTGRCCRLLLDAGAVTPDEVERRWAAELSRGADPAAAAAWIEGFLRDSGTLLVHDPVLWPLLDRWLSGLTDEGFTAVLPLLRRTVTTWAAPERRRLGERAKETAGAAGRSRTPGASGRGAPFDHARAAAVVPTIALLLGLDEAAAP